MKYLILFIFLLPLSSFAQTEEKPKDNIGLSYRNSRSFGYGAVINYEHWLNEKRSIRIGLNGNIKDVLGILTGYRRKWINYKRLMILGGVDLGVTRYFKTVTHDFSSTRYHIDLPMDIRFNIFKRLSLYTTCSIGANKRVSKAFTYPSYFFDFYIRSGIIINL